MSSAVLSGGVASASVGAAMARVSDRTVRTFTVGFEEPAFDVRRYAKLLAERYGTEHHEFVVRPDAVEVLPKLVWHYGEPFADSSAVPTYFLAEVTRPHVPMASTADGGDGSFSANLRFMVRFRVPRSVFTVPGGDRKRAVQGKMVVPGGRGTFKKKQQE